MTHHAYYIEGPLSLFEEYKAVLKPFWANTFERFGVDDARALGALASFKNFKEATYFVGVSSITTEAQQALLKLLEEPQQGTTFVLLVPHGSLLPTVRSRMAKYPPRAVAAVKNQAVVQFLKASGKERSDMLTKLLKDDLPAQADEGVKERVRDFVNALEAELSKKIQDPAVREGLQDIAKVRDYVRDRSPSLKMLLEHLALCLPKS